MLTFKVLFVSFWIRHLGSTDRARVDEGLLCRCLLITACCFLQFGLLGCILLLGLNLLLASSHVSCIPHRSLQYEQSRIITWEVSYDRMHVRMTISVGTNV